MVSSIRFLFFAALSCSALFFCNSCRKQQSEIVASKQWTWHHIRYNEHIVYDTAGRNIISRSNDTTTGSQTDTIYFVNAQEWYFQKLNYFLIADSDSIRKFQHLIYDSSDPTCDMAYYVRQDSVYITMNYSTHSNNYLVSDNGVEYWWTQK